MDRRAQAQQNGRMDGRVKGQSCVLGRTDRQTGTWLEEDPRGWQRDGRVAGQTDGQGKGQADGQRKRWTDGHMEE